MTDETAETGEPAPAPRSAPLSDEDRRLLAALLDELLGNTKDGRSVAQPQGVAPKDAA